MKNRYSAALVLAVAATLLVLSAAGGATAALMITGKQIKDGTVTGKDVKNRSLTVKDFSRKTKRSLRGRTGATGPAGPAGTRGATGPAGPQGLPGLSGFEVVSSSVPVNPIAGVPFEVSAVCPAGKKAIAATGGFTSPLSGLLSEVTRTSDTAFKAVGLATLPVLPGELGLDVVCAAIPG